MAKYRFIITGSSSEQPHAAVVSARSLTMAFDAILPQLKNHETIQSIDVKIGDTWVLVRGQISDTSNLAPHALNVTGENYEGPSVEDGNRTVRPIEIKLNTVSGGNETHETETASQPVYSRGNSHNAGSPIVVNALWGAAWLVAFISFFYLSSIDYQFVPEILIVGILGGTALINIVFFGSAAAIAYLHSTTHNTDQNAQLLAEITDQQQRIIKILESQKS